MSVPTHDPFCQTKTYRTPCWYCAQEIFIFQCSCGSAALFEQLGPPWPKHICTDIGGGWTTIDTLRMQAPIAVPDIKPEPEPAIERIAPKTHANRDILAVVRELHSSTKRTKDIGALSELGVKLRGLDPGAIYRQITLVDTSTRPNESYTALIPDRLMQGLETHVMVTAQMSARGIVGSIDWVITEINPL